jgi:hypothetical protein
LIIVILSRYGYHGLNALLYNVEAYLRERDCAEYTADVTGALLIRVYRYTGAENFDFPLFSDRYKEKPKEMTAQEIKEHVLSLLR